MTLEQFRDLARDYDLVPIHREVLFDTNTAVTAYAKIRDGKYSFLFESVIGGEKWARYTFLGSAPREVVTLKGRRIQRWTREDGWADVAYEGDPLGYLDQRLKSTRVAPIPGLPRFFGGAVGFMGYDVVRYVENLPNAPVDDRDMPDAVLMFTDTLVAIDNIFGKAIIIAMAMGRIGDGAMGRLGDSADRRNYEDAVARIDDIERTLHSTVDLPPLSPNRPIAQSPIRPSYATRTTREEYMAAVEQIREYIRAGDAFQVVLSQRLEVPLRRTPLDAYRALRSLNPSPYLYLLELDGIALIGSSPEVLVRVEDRRVIVKPIAGTRRRGKSEEEDLAIAAELLADEKERAEHLMLVDLGRNDVGRVATYGSVEVKDFMQIERYSHVLHIVTQVEGELREGLSAIDVLRACFPAGTVSGAPKVRAMEIIDELEPVRRGPYAGAVGYFAYGGEAMDTAIAIRTVVAVGDRAYVQAGAGVVLDSDAAAEWDETLAKAAAMLVVCDSVTTPRDGAL